MCCLRYETYEYADASGLDVKKKPKEGATQ
jgi:hypothetical protein